MSSLGDLLHELRAAPAGDDDAPTWGPRTPEVEAQAAASCASGAIVSWDTTPPETEQHRYLRRITDAQGTRYEIWSYPDLVELAPGLVIDGSGHQGGRA